MRGVSLLLINEFDSLFELIPLIQCFCFLNKCFSLLYKVQREACYLFSFHRPDLVNKSPVQVVARKV